MARIGAEGAAEPRVAVLVLLAVLFVICCAQLPSYFKIRNSTQWPAVPGVITDSQVLYHQGRFDLETGILQFRYRVGGAEYLGTRRTFEHVLLTGEEWRRIMNSYPFGKTVTVYYDPSDPSVAVLEPGLVGDLKFLFKLIFVLMATSAVFFLILVFDYLRHRRA